MSDQINPVAGDGLGKWFGATLALDGMSFTVQPGQVTGFVDPTAVAALLTHGLPPRLRYV